MIKKITTVIVTFIYAFIISTIFITARIEETVMDEGLKSILGMMGFWIAWGLELLICMILEKK